MRDDLTGLLLRGSLKEDFQRLAASPPASLLLCDLDYLKLINDSLGHPAGDEVLRTLSAALQSGLGPDWWAYRFGGDEFAVLAPVAAAELAGWANELLLTLAQRRAPISLSVGITELPTERADLASVMAEADRRLYAAKRRGRGRVMAQAAPPGGFETQPRRLLEREQPSAAAARWLSQALHQRGELDVQAPPGGGLSAFLEQVGVVARTLGYQTLHLSGHAARQCQHLGSWHHAALDGQPLPPELEPSGFKVGHKPLALLLDTPECFDAGTATWLHQLSGQAQAVVRAQTRPRPASPGGALISLAPLSEQAVGALLAGLPGADEGSSRWLRQRSGGRPAPLHRWISAVRLEAELRHEPLSQLLRRDSAEWEAALAQQFGAAVLWPRPTLYGRQAEMQLARRQLEHSALLSVTGPAQRGKTRFAEQLLGELAGSFGRALSVALPESLQPATDPASLLARVAEALLGRPSAHVDAASVGRLLARQPTLLLLDVPAGHPPLPARQIEALLNHAPLSRIIVAARTPLGARHESVQMLALLSDLAVSAALLDARPDLAGRPQTELAALLEWVGGEPLRLGAAAALLRRGRSELGGPGLQQLLVTLGQVGAPGDFSAAERLFGEHEQRVLAALGHVGGPVDLTWAGQLSGASPFLLGALRDQQYMQALGGGLYRLSGAAALSTSGKGRSPALRRRLARRWLERLSALLSAEPPGSAAWYAQLDQHYPSLRAVTTSLVSGGLAPRRAPPEPLLAEALLALTPYRLSRDYLHDARAELEVLLRRTGLPPDLRSPLQLAAVQVLQHLGQHQAAQRLLDGLPGGDREQPHAALIQARLLHRRSQYAESLALFNQVHAQLSTQTGFSAELLIRAQDGSARSAIYLGQLAHAQPLITQALEQARALTDPLLLSDLLNTAALVATEQRDLERAGELFAEAIEIHRAFGHRAGLTLNLTGLAWAALLAGDAARSADLSRQVLRQAQDAGRTWEIANALINLAHALCRSGELAQAREIYCQGAELAREHDAPSLFAEALGGLAEVLHREGQSRSAAQVLAAALAHPGANAEMRQYFADLSAQLQPPETWDLTQLGEAAARLLR